MLHFRRGKRLTAKLHQLFAEVLVFVVEVLDRGLRLALGIRSFGRDLAEATGKSAEFLTKDSHIEARDLAVDEERVNLIDRQIWLRKMGFNKTLSHIVIAACLCFDQFHHPLE